MTGDSIPAKIQLQAHRLRCPKCLAIDDDFLFLIEEGMKHKLSFKKPKISKPMFMHPISKTLRLNRTNTLESTRILVRLCILCGDTRKTSVSKRT